MRQILNQTYNNRTNDMNIIINDNNSIDDYNDDEQIQQ